MEIEINLQEGLKAATKNFTSKITAIIDVMKDLTGNYISDVNNEVM